MSRQASIYLDDIYTLEAAGELLFKHVENASAIRLLAIALRLRGQTGLGAELSERGGVEQLERGGLADSASYGSPRSLSFAITDYSGLSEPPVAVVPGAAELTERETRGADGSEWPPRPRSVNFACDIDESAGMAEVVELRGYSRKVVCD